MLNRRHFLAATGGILIGMTTRAGRSSEQTPRAVVESGWLPDKKQTQKFKTHQRVPMFAQAGRHLAGTGAGKVARHWKIYEAVTGSPFDPHDQGIGDCVAHGWGLGIDFLDTIQIIQGNGEWKGKCATEIIYTGGRVEIGNGVIRRDGMHGSWAGRWCNEYGVLLRQPYLDGKYDFTTYSAAKSRKWGHNCRRCTAWGGGVPDELEPLCKLHPVKTITLVTSWEQARDAIYNGYPVAICSNQGFSERRDADGFAATEGTWYHCMLLGGIDDSGRRPGGLLINSWGTDWIEGPTRLDQPVGSFWADAEHIDSMLAQEDSFALSNYVGYPRQDLDYKLY